MPGTWSNERDDPDLVSEATAPPRASGPARESGAADAAALGQAVAERLLSAGFDLNSGPLLSHDGIADERLRHAVAEIDAAVKDLQHLMLALPEQVARTEVDRL